MNAPALAANQSPLEAALHDVFATLSLLLVAADEQYAAVAADDRERIDSVTRQQERLSARLARAEAQRIHLTGSGTPTDWTANLPLDVATRLDELNSSIASAVRELKARQARTAGLLTDKIELASNTLTFLRRLVTQPAPTYTGRGMSTAGQSVLVDSRA
jgi:flagellar biosynthesis/type III secretory pathway chaperone